MSEYQYDEFLALDRPLEKSEMAALRALSTRADITSTGFSNVCNYGDFKSSAAKLMDFAQRFRQLQMVHGRRSALRQRLEKAKLLG